MGKTRIIAIVLMLVAAIAGISAAGLKEQGADETLVRVLSISKADDGVYRIEALKEDGSTVIYLAGEDCSSSYPLDKMEEGDYLMVTGNGIMTMSLPPQSPAVSIRYVTPAVVNGLISADFTTPRQYPGLILDIAEINEEDLSSRFSYAYGYATAVQDYVSMIQVDPVSFTEGALTAVYGLEPLMDASARETAVNDYVTQLVNDYTAQIEALAAENLQKAEAFLAENKSVEGIVETESGLQYEVVKQGDGAVPAEGDTVIVNYTLRDIDGNMLETADGTQFSLSGLIPGFAEAVRNMQVGGEVIAYVHPDLGYGESGAGTAVEPNALLIFDIELVGIANSETEAAQ